MPDCGGCTSSDLTILNNYECAKSDDSKYQISKTNLFDSVSSITTKIDCAIMCMTDPDCVWASWDVVFAQFKSNFLLFKNCWVSTPQKKLVEPR